MSDDKDDNEQDFSLADNQPLPGLSVSNGRTFKPSSKIPQPTLTRLQSIAAETMKVAALMQTVEEAMSERFDELNSSRSRFIRFDPELFLSLSDCRWQRSGHSLTLSHVRQGGEGLASLTINIHQSQENFADAILKHLSPSTSIRAAAIQAAIKLEANNNNTPKKEMTD